MYNPVRNTIHLGYVLDFPLLYYATTPSLQHSPCGHQSPRALPPLAATICPTPVLLKQKKIRTHSSKRTDSDNLCMVEHRRLELLTPTLPVLCATNCANAPSDDTNFNTEKRVCKAFFQNFFTERSENGSASLLDSVGAFRYTETVGMAVCFQSFPKETEIKRVFRQSFLFC